MLGHRFRHVITVQQKTNTQNPETGETIETWSDWLTNEPAEVLTGPGREFMDNGAMQADTTARINIRYQPGLDQSMRIIWEGRTYNIKTFTLDRTGRKFYMINCGDEGVNNG